MLGFAGRAGWADIPEVLTRTDVMILSGVLFAVEFLVDKVPYLDSVWDAIHTVVRPLGAAALGLVLSGEATSVGTAVAALVAGALALDAHVAKPPGSAHAPEPQQRWALRQRCRLACSSRWPSPTR
jgi:hypothetical protein